MSDVAINHTVVVDTYRTGLARPRSYRDLPIYAYEEIHLMAADTARAQFPAGGKVMDLGAGAGALSLRLADQGFDVTALDYVHENFRLHGQIDFRQCDLNDRFGEGFAPESFDAVVAVEIVEHLENPRNLAREAMKLLRPGGYLLLTTPNVDSVFSLLSQLRYGHADLFEEECYRSDGHITPVSAWLLRHAVVEVGFETVFCRSFCERRPAWWKYRAAMWFLRALAADKALAAGSTVSLLARKPGA
jgi:SAM-dependent methyltransferase